MQPLRNSAAPMSGPGTQEPRRRTARGSAYWGVAEIVRGGAEPPPMTHNGSHDRLFDDLVGAQQDRFRQLDANRLGGLEVDDQLEFVGLLAQGL